MAGSGKAHLRPEGQALLRVEDLVVEFPVGRTGLKVNAVSGISLDVLEGETLGLVGESGCGKSTTGKAIMQLPAPTSGQVVFEGTDLTSLDGEDLRRKRTRLQMIFQDPISSLNPRRKVEDIIAEGLHVWNWSEKDGIVKRDPSAATKAASVVHFLIAGLYLLSSVFAFVSALDGEPVRWIGVIVGLALAYSYVQLAIGLWAVSPGSWRVAAALNGVLTAVAAVASLFAREAIVSFAAFAGALILLFAPPVRRQLQRDRAGQRRKVDELMETIGFDPAAQRGKRPHQFSGGQCQRISIARAVATEPKLIICDEPVSALDVSVQAQILNLLEDMKARYGLTMIFIAHDLAVVKNISDRVVVMYLGKICEVGPPDQLYAQPAHPYTQALLAAIPIPDPTIDPTERPTLGGEIPSPVSPPSGCRFRTRCPLAQDVCASEEPQLREAAPGQFVACHFPLAAGETLPTGATSSAEAS